MSIEIGNYVRTNDGLIFKIFTKTKTTYGFCGLTDSSNKKYSTYTYGKGNCIDNNIKGKIVKHSKNIIDLIEEGDIIEFNGEKYQVIYDESYNKLGILIPNKNYLAIKHSSLEFVFEQNKYVTILTKEQYMQNCYTVKRS